MRRWLCGVWAADNGQDVIEYSLLIAFVALATAVIMGTMSPSISSITSVTNTNLNNAVSTAGS